MFKSNQFLILKIPKFWLKNELSRSSRVIMDIEGTKNILFETDIFLHIFLNI